MFLRFSKGKFNNSSVIYSKCVLLGDSAVMEYDNKIVGIAKLHESTDKYNDYDIIVANCGAISAEKIARNLKNFIGKSFKFAAQPDERRRKYYVEEVAADCVPVMANIVFTRI